MRNLIAASLLLLAAATPAWANLVPFSGTIGNTNPPASGGGSCAPGLNVSIGPANTSGTSNFGSFTFTESHCIATPPPSAYNNGVFDFTFSDGDQLLGTYTGTLTSTSTMGLFDNSQNYIVTGGTGLFADASGAFTGTGTVMRPPTGPAVAQQNFSGTLNLPEPFTLSLFGAGLAGAVAMRRRKAKA